MSADPAADLRDSAVAPLLAQIAKPLTDYPELQPVRPVEGQRFYEHPSGWVAVAVSPRFAVWFSDVAALDGWLEELDRERCPGADPWAPVTDLAEYHAKFQALRDERDGL